MRLRVLRQVNGVGGIEFSLRGNHPAIALLEDRGIVEAWRKNIRLGLGWTCEGRGLFLCREQATVETDTFTARCPGPLWLLGTRVVAYPPQLPGLSLLTGAAGEIARRLVCYNTGAEASVENGRVRAGGVNWIVVEAGDPGTGELVWECSGANLLTTLQDLASVTGSDFTLEYEPPAEWHFQWYAGICGEDRSAAVRLSLENGTLLNPLLKLDQRKSANAAIAAGMDEDGSPIYAVQEGLWEASEGDEYPEGRTVEVYGYTQNARTVEELAARAKLLLARSTARPRLDFDLLQTPSCALGVHYGLGDLITAVYRGMVMRVQVRRVAFEVGEAVRIGCQSVNREQ